MEIRDTVSKVLGYNCHGFSILSNLALACQLWTTPCYGFATVIRWSSLLLPVSPGLARSGRPPDPPGHCTSCLPVIPAASAFILTPVLLKRLLWHMACAISWSRLLLITGGHMGITNLCPSHRYPKSA